MTERTVAAREAGRPRKRVFENASMNLLKVIGIKRADDRRGLKGLQLRSNRMRLVRFGSRELGWMCSSVRKDEIFGLDHL